MNPYEISAGVFIRGLTNLKAQLKKAEEHSAAHGVSVSAFLAATAGDGAREGALGEASPFDLHRYTLAKQVHWAGEGARRSIERLLGATGTPAADEATNFGDLNHHLDATIEYIRGIPSSDLDAGLDREIVIEHRRGTMRASGRQFLIAYAIPHFFYHVNAAYGIMRNQGVPLTMADYLGNWPSS